MPQRVPSYITDMLNMAVAADGYFFPPPSSTTFPLYNQIFALASSASLLWHVSCELTSWQNMSAVVLSAFFYNPVQTEMTE